MWLYNVVIDFKDGAHETLGPMPHQEAKSISKIYKAKEKVSSVEVRAANERKGVHV